MSYQLDNDPLNDVQVKPAIVHDTIEAVCVKCQRLLKKATNQWKETFVFKNTAPVTSIDGKLIRPGDLSFTIDFPAEPIPDTGWDRDAIRRQARAMQIAFGLCKEGERHPYNRSEFTGRQVQADLVPDPDKKKPGVVYQRAYLIPPVEESEPDPDDQVPGAEMPPPAEVPDDEE